MLTVMTGGTRGLGRIAAERLAADARDVDAGHRPVLIMGARDGGSVPAGWISAPLDLGSLDSVAAFAASLPDEPVARLILNAGGQRPDVAARSKDGFEETFATNHLAHFLLLRLLMPRFARGARIVITSSGTHDPQEKTGVPPPRHANVHWLAYPDQDPQGDTSKMVAGMRAYSTSKLANLMTARYLAHSDDARAGAWRVFAYDPGLTPGTGLARNQPWPIRALVWPLLPLMLPFAKGMNRLSDAGRGLYELATTAQAPEARSYAALRRGALTWPLPSSLARDEALVAQLWEDSDRLVDSWR
jgi:NAD(P)-dependent dehydrogenase (short-subunit alcohol dehydrogenase family)